MPRKRKVTLRYLKSDQLFRIQNGADSFMDLPYERLHGCPLLEGHSLTERLIRKAHSLTDKPGKPRVVEIPPSKPRKPRELSGRAAPNLSEEERSKLEKAMAEAVKDAAETHSLAPYQRYLRAWKKLSHRSDEPKRLLRQFAHFVDLESEKLL